MSSLDSREEALRKKNAELEQRKRQLEQELEQLQTPAAYLEFAGDEEPPAQPTEPPQHKQDIISEIEAVNRIQAQRNANRLAELRELTAANRKRIAQQKQKASSLQASLEQGEKALELKQLAVAELESKGKKISEETKKWIAEIAKLTDKCEELRDKSSLLNKELEGLNHQMTTADKNLKSSANEKRQLEQEDRSLTGRIASLGEEVQLAKEQLKDSNQAGDHEIQAIKRNNDRVRLNQKRLERQKAELIKAFRKLNNYIALIRKQNIHIQTARTLNFTQEEFLQAVDKTDRM